MKKNHLLVVEDDTIIRNALCHYLTSHHFSVQEAASLQQAYQLLQNQRFSCIILDRMLPDGEWIELCHTIKTTHTDNIPIIITTAKWQLDDKLEWFDHGADDYLVKPFDLEELLARINVLTNNNQSTRLIKRKNISIDFTSQQLFKENTEIKLTHKQFLILKLLIINKGRVLSRSDIIEEIWWGDAIREKDNDNTLDAYISTIRKKISKEIISTIKWVGYKFG